MIRNILTYIRMCIIQKNIDVVVCSGYLSPDECNKLHSIRTSSTDINIVGGIIRNLFLNFKSTKQIATDVIKYMGYERKNGVKRSYPKLIRIKTYHGDIKRILLFTTYSTLLDDNSVRELAKISVSILKNADKMISVHLDNISYVEKANKRKYLKELRMYRKTEFVKKLDEAINPLNKKTDTERTTMLLDILHRYKSII